jgi:hypothetical protein
METRHTAGGGNLPHWVEETLPYLHPLLFLKVQADLIPALRTLSEVKRDGLSIEQKGAMFKGRRYFGGTATAELLFFDQHPPVGQEARQ